MTLDSAPYIFSKTLLNRGLHFDFLRLRCGSDATFHQSVAQCYRDKVIEAVGRRVERPRTFGAFSEWDAVMLLPCEQLYPQILSDFYATPAIAGTIAGTSGYFGYLWNHEINAKLDDKLNKFEAGGIGFMISLRFDDWVRRDFGLGAELLFCDFVQRESENTRLSSLVAHTLGWNDVVVILHADSDEKQLTQMISRIRLVTPTDLLGERRSHLTGVFREHGASPLFAASYTHTILGSGAILQGQMALGALAEEVVAATLLVRVAAPLEWRVRREIERLSAGELTASAMPTEMGHYSLSADLTGIVGRNGGRDALALVASIRDFIGKSGGELPSTYAETTTIFRYHDPSDPDRRVDFAMPDDRLIDAIKGVKSLMTSLSDQLKGRNVSLMTIHRFAAVLTALLDHLSDPIRSSVVRHLTRFLLRIAEVIPDLDRQDLEDLCQICEYATAQATDGVVQFQHDANALGLTGRGGYSRLIAAVETYVQDIFDALDVDRNVLITFGLHVGHVGSIGRFQIDVPFNVLFVPSRWYILLHEVGHIAWGKRFGWMAETLAVFDYLEQEIALNRPGGDPSVEMDARLEFIRTREILRELFPNLLVYRLACGGSLAEFDRLCLRHILSDARPGGGTRELLIAVVLHCLFILSRTTMDVGARWLAAFVDLNPKDVDQASTDAINSMADALHLPDEHLASHAKLTIPNKQKLLLSLPFREAVNEAVKSVLKVLGFTARKFTEKGSLGGDAFDAFENAIAVALSDQAKVEVWPVEGFADWLSGGEILAIAPGAHVWSKLLLQSRKLLKESPVGSSFMVSQLAVLLSIWHRAATSPDSDDRTTTILRERLLPLELVTRKSFSPHPRPQQPREEGQ